LKEEYSFLTGRKKSKKEKTIHITMLGALVYFKQRKLKVNRKIFNDGKNGINRLTLKIESTMIYKKRKNEKN
jgi:hypothetical protein